METKICKECKVEKSVNDFSRAYPKTNPSNLRRNTCNNCRKIYHKKYRDENRDILRVKDLKKYWNKTEKERKAYIKKKSKQNQKRFKINSVALENRNQYSKSDKGIFSRYRYDSTRRGRNYEFKLTLEEFSKLINSNCTYCGKPNSRGVDRVDNSKGYILDNCTPCCKICNEMKMTKSLEEFKMYIVKIYDNLKLGN